MGLSTELISEFVKITNDNKKGKDEKTVFGTVKTVSEDGKSGMVKIDGSDELTPFTTTCTVTGEDGDHQGDRVRLNIRNHNAIVTGNMSSPAFGVQAANGLRSEITQTLSEISLEVENEIAGLDSKITLTAGEIRSEVTDKVNGLNSKITQNANSITSVVKNQNEFSEFKQTVEGFSFMGNGGTVKIKGGDINLTGAISFSDLSDATTYTNKINGAVSDASDALDAASDAQDTADGVLTTVNGITIKEGSKTYLDGEMLYTNSVYADAMHLGGALTVYRTLYGNNVGGYLGYDSGFNSASGIGIRDSSEVNQVVCTNAAARVSSGDPTSDRYYSQFVASDDYAYIEASTAIIFEIDGTSFIAVTDHGTYGSLRPHANAPTMHLGNASYRWGGVYATNGEIQTSDRNHKNSIEHLPDKYVTLFDNITPRRFKMNNGSSGRYHVGYIAQEVEEAMLKAGVDSLEFGGFVRDIDADGKEICMLRYGEFDGIRDLKIKQLESRIDELERRLANLEAKEVG